jgi:HSP20 family protein
MEGLTMNLVRRAGPPVAIYRPRSLEDQFGRMVESIFEDLIAPVAQAAALSRISEDGTISPRIDISENEKAYTIKAEMPGAKKEDVKVSIDGQRVTIEADVKREEEKREGENAVMTERTVRKYVRSFMLPTEVDDSAADARLEDGILTLTLPKKQAAAAKRLTIQ